MEQKRSGRTTFIYNLIVYLTHRHSDLFFFMDGKLHRIFVWNFLFFLASTITTWDIERERVWLIQLVEWKLEKKPTNKEVVETNQVASFVLDNMKQWRWHWFNTQIPLKMRLSNYMKKGFARLCIEFIKFKGAHLIWAGILSMEPHRIMSIAWTPYKNNYTFLLSTVFIETILKFSVQKEIKPFNR